MTGLHVYGSRERLGYFLESSGVVLTVTVDDDKWYPGLTASGETQISSASDSISDRTANWFGETNDGPAQSGISSEPRFRFDLDTGRNSCVSIEDKLMLTVRNVTRRKIIHTLAITRR